MEQIQNEDIKKIIKSLAEMAARWYISIKQKKGVAEHP